LFTDFLDLNSYTAFCTLSALVYQVIGGSLSEVLIGLEQCNGFLMSRLPCLAARFAHYVV